VLSNFAVHIKTRLLSGKQKEFILGDVATFNATARKKWYIRFYGKVNPKFVFGFNL